MLWNDRIRQFNQMIPISMEHLDNHMFRFKSSMETWVYGKLFMPNIKRPKKEIIVLYHGLGAHTGTKGYIDIAQFWADQGFYVIGMDCRHQGGKTLGMPNRHPDGLYLSGIEDDDTYYYHQVYLDAYRLIDVATILIPHAKIYTTGGSQGGALAIFAGTYHQAVSLVMADMPSCIDILYLIHFSDSGFNVFRDYIKQISRDSLRILSILSEIDLAIVSSHLNKPILLSSGDQDLICPLKTTQTFYDIISTEKRLVIYPGFGHGGYDDLHWPEKLNWILKHAH